MGGSEQLDEPTRAFEAIALGLRQVAGLSRAAFADEFGTDPVERFAAAIGDGADLLEVDRDTIRLTSRGRLFANEALVAFAP
jgi:coproporphyrinogen III oxidase-like Fe-S oxidoreductase